MSKMAPRFAALVGVWCALGCGQASRTQGSGGAPASAGNSSGGGSGAPVQAGGTNTATAGTGSGGVVDAEGCERCGQLPHVKPGALVDCVNGQCVFTADDCEDGFEHCEGDFSEVGCESDLSDPAHCGRCSRACGENQVCLVPSGYVCSTCSFPTASACRNDCANLQNDSAHCGSCGNACAVTEMCSEGACAECPPLRANCAGQNRCDDWLRSSAHCGSCGRDCSTAEMHGGCTPKGDCEPLACVVGRADCDANPDDCEAELAQAATCGPEYVGTTTLNADYTWLALGADGSSFVTLAGKLYKLSSAGALLWSYSAPSGDVSMVAVDTGGVVFVAGYFTLNPGQKSADIGTFVTKLDEEGEPVWEHRFEPVAGAGQIVDRAIAVDGSGTVLLAAVVTGDVDVDPTSGVDVQHFDSRQTWLFELDASGAVSWARGLETNSEQPCQINVHALARGAGRALVAGTLERGCSLAGEEAPGAPTGEDGVVGGESGFIASLSSSAAADTVRWLPGAYTDSGETRSSGPSVIAYADGSAALVAGLSSELWLGDSERLLATVERPRRFLARFSAELELQWLKVADGISFPAAAPDGGVLAMVELEARGPKLLSLWREDGSSAWTLAVGCQWLESAGAAGAIFAARSAGTTDPGPTGCDLDPGPEVVEVTENAMVTTYRF